MSPDPANIGPALKRICTEVVGPDAAAVGFPEDEAAALSALHTRNFM